ncbi:ultraviolet-B receptor UVR8 isoform X2 [Andrographis paniculata]|uniref:ultraviolet-B receptor UVR8 isoform X2 n=1 Tax=Andrographis paniculata TaxID=175694 RepID=UPI0021E91DA4|nr:ultraviolet-B receptor UVR8 isoform X2 [Andrographis paniculata]
MAAVSRAYARAKKLAPVLNLASKESPAFGSVPRRWVSVDNGGRAEELNKGKRFVGVWGNGDFGRLGLGSLDSQWRPKPIASSAFDDQSLIEVACGGAHTVFLTENGDVYATGLNDFGQLGISDFQNYAIKPLRISSIPKRIIKISAGYHHSAAITVDGELYVWGKNANGQLGLGKKAENIIPLPRKVECLDGVTIKSVSLGFEHSIAVTDKGEALSWGGGESGRLGHGHGSSIFGFQTSSSEYTPRLIKGLEGIKVKSVAAGMLHSTCICENGCVYFFGERELGKWGFGKAKSATTPSMISPLPTSEEVACGGYHTCVVTNGGEMYTWGSNENGCLGIGGTDISYTPERVQGPLLRQSVTKVALFTHGAGVDRMERLKMMAILPEDNWDKATMLTTASRCCSTFPRTSKLHKYLVDLIIQRPCSNVREISMPCN